MHNTVSLAAAHALVVCRPNLFGKWRHEISHGKYARRSDEEAFRIQQVYRVQDPETIEDAAKEGSQVKAIYLDIPALNPGKTGVEQILFYLAYGFQQRTPALTVCPPVFLVGPCENEKSGGSTDYSGAVIPLYQHELCWAHGWHVADPNFRRWNPQVAA